MATTSKVWYDDYLPTTIGDLATMSSEAGVAISISLHNIHATPQTVDLALNTDGTSRNIARISLAQYESATISGLHLADADIIRGVTTTATAVSCHIFGGSLT